MRKISIIIPCHNVAPYIDRCMSSIAVQTIGMESLEIICVDDASTDDTWAHLRKWERAFPDHVILIQQEINRRQGAARNLGLVYASADWISFVDGDDWLEPDYFEQLYRHTVQYDCDVVFCADGGCRDASDALVYFDRESRRVEDDLYVTADTKEKRNLLIVSLIAGETVWGKIVRKKLLTDFQIYFPEDLVYEDLYWTSLLHVHMAGMYGVGEKLYHYFANSQSTVTSRNADHHVDWITVQVMKWAEYRRRGLFREYRREVEYDMLRDAIRFVKNLILRYDKPPFSLFHLERELVKEFVPDYKRNPYTAELTGVSHLLLEALYSAADRVEFDQMVNQIKESWGDI